MMTLFTIRWRLGLTLNIFPKLTNTKQVIAGADIFNTQGILLIKKGQPISKAMVARIVQFKLLRPLETSIDIEDSLNAEKLIAAVEESLHDQNTRDYYLNYLGTEVAGGCRQFFQYPLLAQKLTVLSVQMPEEFIKSLRVAWSALAIGLRMNLPKADRINLFIAALMHDIGMLHIDRAIITKKPA